MLILKVTPLRSHLFSPLPPPPTLQLNEERGLIRRWSLSRVKAFSQTEVCSNHLTAVMALTSCEFSLCHVLGIAVVTQHCAVEGPSVPILRAARRGLASASPCPSWHWDLHGASPIHQVPAEKQRAAQSFPTCDPRRPEPPPPRAHCVWPRADSVVSVLQEAPAPAPRQPGQRPADPPVL